MKRYLPSFAAITAFEAAAKHQNFKNAAQEIHLSASAISHQIRSLEDFLGIPLFVRENGNVYLTPQGADYYQAISNALSNIEDATLAICPRGHKRKLTINLDYSMFSCWLENWVQPFCQQHPDVNIELISSEAPPDNTVNYDVAIHYSQQDKKEDNTYHLIEDYMTLVASPEVAAQLPKEEDMDQLAKHTLLNCSLELHEWPTWFSSYELEYPKKISRLAFNNRFSVLNSAVNSMGVAIGRQPYVNKYLLDKTLVIPYKKRIATGLHCYLTISKSSIHNPLVNEFKKCLMGEIAKLVDITH